MAEPNEQMLPAWVTETPEQDFGYNLMMESQGSWIDEVELTRDEYIELKRHLAVMRGLIPQTVEATLEHMPAESILYPMESLKLLEQARELLDKFLRG